MIFSTTIQHHIHSCHQTPIYLKFSDRTIFLFPLNVCVCVCVCVRACACVQQQQLCVCVWTTFARACDGNCGSPTGLLGRDCASWSRQSIGSRQAFTLIIPFRTPSSSRRPRLKTELSSFRRIYHGKQNITEHSLNTRIVSRKWTWKYEPR